jgi:hypothetical protein
VRDKRPPLYHRPSKGACRTHGVANIGREGPDFRVGRTHREDVWIASFSDKLLAKLAYFQVAFCGLE